jgi:hypothetical protein
MSRNVASTEKRIVDQLSFGRKTAKRVTWEAWEFEIVGPQQIEVTNASYGFEKGDHRYIVTVEDRDGVFVPDKCECPADQYNEEYSCKHRVAVATIGGPVVLGAAMVYTSDGGSHSGPITMADKIRTDGGTDVRTDRDKHVDGDTGANNRPDDCDCGEWNEGLALPCWPCYRDGFEMANPDQSEGSQ